MAITCNIIIIIEDICLSEGLLKVSVKQKACDVLSFSTSGKLFQEHSDVVCLYRRRITTGKTVKPNMRIILPHYSDLSNHI